MASLSALLKLNSTAEQLFVWQVLGTFIGAYLTPFIRAATYDINDRDPNLVLSPADLADMVLRGHKGLDDAAKEAAKSGLNYDRFKLLVDDAGSPPGPMDLARALHLGLIPESSGNPLAPGYIEGIRQSRIQNQWADVVKELARDDPSAQYVINAYIRGQLGDSEIAHIFEQVGGNPKYFQLMLDSTGEGPSPNEAAIAARRGAIPWTGVGPGVTSFEQAVRESAFRNKWQATFQALAQYYPPPRTIQAMYREGTIDQQTATDWLQKYGVAPENVPFFLTKTTHTVAQKVHEASEALILQLYTEKALSKEQAQDILKKHGYSDSDILIILEAADLHEKARKAQQSIAIVRKAFIERRTDRNTASTMLDAAGVHPDQRDYLLKLWEFEQQVGTKNLTEVQIMHLMGAGLINESEALQKLQGIGYSADDAHLLITLAQGPPSQLATGPMGNVIGQLVNPVPPQQPYSYPPGTVLSQAPLTR